MIKSIISHHKGSCCLKKATRPKSYEFYIFNDKPKNYIIIFIIIFIIILFYKGNKVINNIDG